jgi:hypothetical protein
MTGGIDSATARRMTSAMALDFAQIGANNGIMQAEAKNCDLQGRRSRKFCN